jgi:hypothetical protein
MPSNSHRLLCCLLLGAAALVTLPAFAGEPTAADRKEAKRLYAEARKLRGEGRLDEAVERFRRAAELAPTPVTRLDLARGLAEQSKLVEARALALSIPAMPVTATETEKSKQSRREAEALGKELGERIPTVTLVLGGTHADLRSDQDGQEVAIDGKPVSKELLSAPIALDPGDHVVVVRVGEKTAETPFKLAERETKSVTLAAPAPDEPVKPLPEPPKADPPKAAPQPNPTTRAPEERKQKERSLTPAVPVLLSVGGASLLAGAISGGVALSQVDELENACAPSGACGPDQRDAFLTHEATANASTALFVIGGVVATAGAVVWIVDATTRPSAPPKVALRWTGTGLAMEGTWP